MKLVVPITLVALLGVATWILWSRGTMQFTDLRGKESVMVTLADKGFEPQYIEITRGTKVTFTIAQSEPGWPASNPHPTHILYPEFDPKEPIAPGSSWTFTFDKVGTWGYHDHLRSYYTGTVKVDE